eukprot:9781652-Prorocentrum_lima.AAC.1
MRSELEDRLQAAYAERQVQVDRARQAEQGARDELQGELHAKETLLKNTRKQKEPSGKSGSEIL